MLNQACDLLIHPLHRLKNIQYIGSKK